MRHLSKETVWYGCFLCCFYHDFFSKYKINDSLVLQVCGVCVHQGYSNLANVVEAVHSTGVHLTQSPNAEFALAVHLNPYPACVISVWVYVASLVKRA